MPDDDFHTKEHITKHLTGARYNVIRERTRVNSWEEQDYLLWKEFIARTLTMDRLTPFNYKLLMDAAEKYRKAYKSYKFGMLKAIGSRWVWFLVIGVVVLIVMLYLSGALTFVEG